MEHYGLVQGMYPPGQLEAAALEWPADVDEGMAAHAEGRTPRFTGR